MARKKQQASIGMPAEKPHARRVRKSKWARQDPMSDRKINLDKIGTFAGVRHEA